MTGTDPTEGIDESDDRDAPPPRSRRRRRRIVAALTAVALVALVAGGLWWAGRDTAREVTLDEAAARTSSTTGGDTTSGEGPTPGIYRYEGSGTSSLSVPPLSQDQGPSIPGTVTSEGAGCWSLRVDYSTNHWQDWRYCSSPEGLVEQGGESWQRWMIGPTAITNLSDAVCGDDGLLVLPAEREEGDERDEGCTSTNDAMEGEMTSEGSLRYLGDEDLDVGGATVRTAHFERRREMTGSQSGTERTEVWYAVDTGLPIRNERDIEVRTDTPAGRSTYRETGWFQLASLEPTT